MKKHELHNARSLSINLAFAGIATAASFACTGVSAQAAGPAERPVGKPAGTVGAVEERPAPSPGAAAAGGSYKMESRDRSMEASRRESERSRASQTAAVVKASAPPASAASGAAMKPASAASGAASSAARPKAVNIPSRPVP